MEIVWNFRAATPLYGYCKLIAEEMVRQFRIELSEAIGRINKVWSGRDFYPTEIHQDEIIYHEPTSYWAKEFYYGHDSCWWIVDECKREKLGLRPLEPMRYP